MPGLIGVLVVLAFQWLIGSLIGAVFLRGGHKQTRPAPYSLCWTRSLSAFVHQFGVVRDLDVFLFDAANAKLQYIAELDTVVWASRDGTTLLLHEVVARRMPTLTEILQRLGGPIEPRRRLFLARPPRRGVQGRARTIRRRRVLHGAWTAGGGRDPDHDAARRALLAPSAQTW